MHNFISEITNFLVEFISQIGYLGIFIGMFLESTLVPIPSEIVMIPAGIASSKGLMNFYLVLIFGISGNVLGAGFSYYLAKLVGRKIILKIGKYFFIKEQTIIKIEKFFQSHGSISVFIGRLLPGFRHFISIPAGIAKMNIKVFYFYTTLGSTIWTSILAVLGFLIGENEDLIHQYLNDIIFAILLTCLVLIIIYYKKSKLNN